MILELYLPLILILGNSMIFFEENKIGLWNLICAYLEYTCDCCNIVATMTMGAMTILSRQYSRDNGDNEKSRVFPEFPKILPKNPQKVVIFA